MYLSGDTVLITDIGVGNRGSPDPGSSLVCNTSNVNTNCCRSRDGGNVGEWHFPDGTIVPRSNANPNGDLTRTGYTLQVRLNRRNNATTPLGAYECRVPHIMDNTSTEVHTASIFIGEKFA